MSADAAYKPRSFRRNVLFSAGSTTVGSLAQLALVMVLSRILRANDYAGFLTAVALVAVGDMASDFGTRIWAMREFALKGVSQDTFLVSLYSKLTSSVIVTVIILLLGPHALIISFPDILICIFIACTQPATDPALWYFRGRERLDLEALSVVLYRVAYALVLACLAYLGVPLTLLLIVWLGINVLRITAELTSTPLRFVFSPGSNTLIWYFQQVKRVIPVTFPIGAAFLLVTFYQRLGVLSLNALRDTHQVALYGTAFSLVGAAGFIAVSITNATFPALSRAIEAKNMAAACDLIFKKFSLIALFFVPMTCLGILLSPLAIATLYGADYRDAGFVMVLLMPGLYISSVNFGAKYALNAINMNWQDAVATVISIVVFMAIFFIPLNIQKSEQAAVAWGIGECLGLLLRYSFMRLKGGLKIRHFWFFILLFIGLFALTFLLKGAGLSLRDEVLASAHHLLHH
ncbi:MAG: oligosaccharide flippase family protein [Gammaproteobacteria bacterium]